MHNPIKRFVASDMIRDSLTESFFQQGNGGLVLPCLLA